MASEEGGGWRGGKPLMACGRRVPLAASGRKETWRSRGVGVCGGVGGSGEVDILWCVRRESLVDVL